MNLDHGGAFLQSALHSITGYRFCIIFYFITKTGAYNNSTDNSNTENIKLQVPLLTRKVKLENYSNRFPTARQAQNLPTTVSRGIGLLSPKCEACNEMDSGYREGVSKFKPTLFNRKEN